MPPFRSLCLLAFTIGLAACEVEQRADGDPLVRFAEADTTLACGAYDVPPEDSASRVLFTSRRDSTHRAAPDSAVPKPREVNPPSVEVEGVPPAPEAAAPEAGLLVPVAGVESDELVDTYSEARGQGRVHNALDIMAARGTPVLAAAPGTILRIFESERGGRTLYQLDPDGETVYYYAHLDAYAPGLDAGDEVARGDTLGTVGDSGNAAPGNTHLHFAMWTVADSTQFWEGEPINPYPILRDEAPAATDEQPTRP